MKAVAFAPTFAPRELRVVAFRLRERHLRELRERWRDLEVKVPIEATGHHLGDLVGYVRELAPSQAEPVMVVIPEPQDPNPLRQLRRGHLLLEIKGVLLFQPGVVVASVPFRPDFDPEPDRLRAFRRLSVIVLVAGLHRATLRAIEYAKSLNPTELKALMIAIDPLEGERIAEEWAEAEIDVPLEIVESPYRSILPPLFRAIDALQPNPTDAVAVVIPEFLVPHWWQQLLHGQTAFVIKAALLFRPHVIVIDVPYRLRGLKKRAGRPTDSEVRQLERRK